MGLVVRRVPLVINDIDRGSSGTGQAAKGKGRRLGLAETYPQSEGGCARRDKKVTHSDLLYAERHSHEDARDDQQAWLIPIRIAGLVLCR